MVDLKLSFNLFTFQNIIYSLKSLKYLQIFRGIIDFKFEITKLINLEYIFARNISKKKKYLFLCDLQKSDFYIKKRLIYRLSFVIYKKSYDNIILKKILKYKILLNIIKY